MQSKEQSLNSPDRTSSRVALAITIVLALTVLSTQPLPAQTFKVIHDFNNDADGAAPQAGLTVDRFGNLFGTTAGGGYSGGKCKARGGCGTAFKLTETNSAWVPTTLYRFTGSPDGDYPAARLTLGSDGAIYGTTLDGGDECNCGTVFALKPQPTSPRAVFDPWTETVLYSFLKYEGYQPDGALVFDELGNIYGTTIGGGVAMETCQLEPPPYGCGTVYELSRSSDGWSEKILHSFAQAGDAAAPTGGVIFDKAGNLYGTTNLGGCGAVYKLIPSANGWTKVTLHNFVSDQSEGCSPWGGLIFDQDGNLYGSTQVGGSNQAGTVFRLTPRDGDWLFAVLYNFTCQGCLGRGPRDSLTMDSAGNLYGTAQWAGKYQCGYEGCGSVFKLTPSGETWEYTSLHDFTGGSDGAWPFGGVVLDANGNFYGTAAVGGQYGAGVVWEITP